MYNLGSLAMEWDEYYLNICNAVAQNSKCLSRKIGAILVNDKSIISTGYNGPPRGVPHCEIRHLYDENLQNELQYDLNEPLPKCPRQLLHYKTGEGLHLCIAGHAERNCIINAARHGIKVKGSIMYMNCPVPCTPCLIEIINAGIKEIVFTEMLFYDITTEFLLRNSELTYRTFSGVQK